MSKATVLVLDDEEIIAENLQQIVQEFFPQLNAVKLTDSQEALQFVQENDVKLLITDLLMPKINGIEMIGEMRKLKLFPILVTSSIAGMMEEELKSFHQIELVAKPYDKNSMRDLILKMLKY